MAARAGGIVPSQEVVKVMYGHVARYVTWTRIGSDLYAWCTTLCRAGHYEKIPLPSTCVMQHAYAFTGMRTHIYNEVCTRIQLHDLVCSFTGSLRESGGTQSARLSAFVRGCNDMGANTSVFAFKRINLATFARLAISTLLSKTGSRDDCSEDLFSSSIGRHPAIW